MGAWISGTNPEEPGENNTAIFITSSGYTNQAEAIFSWGCVTTTGTTNQQTQYSSSPNFM